MKSLAPNMETLNTKDVHIEEKITSLAKTLYSYWEKNEQYGHYLLEKKPESFHGVAQDLLHALEKDPQHHRIYIMRNETQQEIGYILLKNYSDYIMDDPIWWHKLSPHRIPNVEASYRSIEKGRCTWALHHVLSDVLDSQPDIQSIIGHHAVPNKSSGCIFHSNGFSVLAYHKKYVYLPNIQEHSDTILWNLERSTYLQDLLLHNGDTKEYMRRNDLRIHGDKVPCKELASRYAQMQETRSKSPHPITK